MGLIPETSANYQEAQVLKYFCNCLKNKDSDYRWLKPDFSVHSVINDNPEIIYQLMLYDEAKAFSICKDILNNSSDFTLLCSKIGSLAFKSGNFNLAKSLFLSSLSSNHRSPEIYRMLGEIFIYLGEKTEGLYFIWQAVLMEPGKSENYICLLKHVVDNFTEQIREVLQTNPHWSLATHHLCALTTFRTKLGGKEVS